MNNNLTFIDGRINTIDCDGVTIPAGTIITSSTNIHLQDNSPFGTLSLSSYFPTTNIKINGNSFNLPLAQITSLNSSSSSRPIEYESLKAVKHKNNISMLKQLLLQEDIETDIHPADKDQECPITYETFTDRTVYFKCKTCMKHISLNAVKKMINNKGDEDEFHCPCCRSDEMFEGPFVYFME